MIRQNPPLPLPFTTTMFRRVSTDDVSRLWTEAE